MTLRFEFIPPSPPLARLIRQHQIIRFSFEATETVPAKPYWPRPSVSLAFYSRDPEWIRPFGALELRRKPRAVLIGQPTRTTLRQGGRDFSVYQIEFQPGAVHMLTGLAIHELTNTDLDAEAVFPRDFAALIREIEDTEDARQMIRAAESWILRHHHRRNREMTAYDAVALQLLQSPTTEIDRVARRHDVGTRQLRRAFQDRMGVSPKLFARIARFDQLVRLSNRFLDTADAMEGLGGIDISDDPDLRPTPNMDRRNWLKLALGAGAVTTVGAVWVMGRNEAEASTRVGERTTVRLDDGARLDLNTDTRIVWKHEEADTRIWLERGELSVTVPTGAKPCMISAADQMVRVPAGDVNMRLRSTALEVIVLGGACLIGSGAKTHKIRAGEGALTSGPDMRIREVRASDRDFATSWRDDVVVIEGQTLAVAVDEYNRYLTRKIIIVDPELSGIRLGGRFSTRDPRDFLATLHTSFGIHVASAKDGTVLLSK